MNLLVQSYLAKQRILVLGVTQEKGIHSATVHFAHSEDPFTFYFMTERNSKKCASLSNGNEATASLVIGFSEEEFIAFQAEGKVKIVTDKAELEKGLDVYLGKFPSRNGRKTDPESVMLQFTPTWWRYRDYKAHPMVEIQA